MRPYGNIIMNSSPYLLLFELVAKTLSACFQTAELLKCFPDLQASIWTSFPWPPAAPPSPNPVGICRALSQRTAADVWLSSSAEQTPHLWHHGGREELWGFHLSTGAPSLLITGFERPSSPVRTLVSLFLPWGVFPFCHFFPR